MADWYTLQEVPGKGWIVHADELRASAQGDTAEEAVANLKALIVKYPEMLRAGFGLELRELDAKEE